MTPFQQLSAFDQPQETSNAGDSTNVGKFETKGVDGKDYTEKVFSDYDLTLVNVFTTWCSPCVNEIPELEKLYEEMKEKGVGVVGVVLDTVSDDAKQNEDTVKKAGVLQEKTKASYPFLVPDSTMMNGRLNGISAFPETFFVDKNGNIVGETYSGSHSLDAVSYTHLDVYKRQSEGFLARYGELFRLGCCCLASAVQPFAYVVANYAKYAC